MSHDHDHVPGEAQAAPPHYPEITDEAPPTPMWLPAVGVGLLVALALVAAVRAKTHSSDTQIVIDIPAVAAEVVPAARPPEAAPHE